MRSSTPGRAGSRYIRLDRDALLVEPLAGAVEGRVRRGAVLRPPAPRPSRSSPCSGGRRRPRAGRRATRRCRRTTSRSSPSSRPAARASATSRGCRTPPSAHTWPPSSAGLPGALEHRGELRAADAGHHPGGAHRAGADTDLDDVGARLDQVPGAVGGDHVAGHERAPAGRASRTARSASIIRSWWPCAVSRTRQSTPVSSSASAFASHVTVHAEAAAIAQPTGVVDGGACRASPAAPHGPGEHPDQPAVGVDDRCDATACGMSSWSNASRGRGVAAQEADLAGSSPRCTWVNRSTSLAVLLGDDPDRATVFDDERRAVRALGDQGQGVGDGVVRGQA